MRFLITDIFTISIFCLPFLALVWLGVIRRARKRQHPINWWRLVIISVFSIYLADVFWNTVSLSIFIMPLQLRGNINLVPILGIIKMADAMIQSSNPWSFINLFGNLALFIPFGFLLPIVFPKINAIWKIFLAGLCLSLTIEIWQLFLPRASDVDDLILNITGALVGYLIFLLIRGVFPALVKRITT
jgi:glycopeptide antibiotics resistance protein